MCVSVEIFRMDVSARAGQQNAIDGIKQRGHVSDSRIAGKHQRQRIADFIDCINVAHTGHLYIKPVMQQIVVAYNSNYRFSHMYLQRYCVKAIQRRQATRHASINGLFKSLGVIAIVCLPVKVTGNSL